MPIRFKADEPAIKRGIKTVGIGKKASQSLGPDLVEEIVRALKADKVTPVARAAFFAGLINKGVSEVEMRLEEALEPGVLRDLSRLGRLAELLAPEAPPWVRRVCGRLLAGETLDVATAHGLGQYLFQPDSCDGAKGLVASFLRVRYETPEEYEGLLKAMNETLEAPFRQATPPGNPIVQLAEPFDGVDRSNMITPLLARELKSAGYRVVTMVGRNSGPKRVFNLLDVTEALQLSNAQSSTELGDPQPEFGWYLHQRDLSQAIDGWVEIRHQTVKRPFLATLEKFINPVGADVLVTSAFHPSYGEKMAAIAERAGYPAAIVVRAGIEGTIGFSLHRLIRLLCTVRQGDGSYCRQEIRFDPAQTLSEKIDTDERLDHPSAAENAQLIQAYRERGKTDNRLFDARVKVTVAGLNQALAWIRNNSGAASLKL